MRIKDLPKASLADILKAFWKAMKLRQWAFYTCMITFSAYSIFQLITPLFYKKFFDTISTPGIDKAAAGSGLVGILVTVLALNICAWVVFRIGLAVLNHYEADTMARIREQSFEYMIDHSYSFFSNNFSGALVQRIGRFSRAFERLYDTLIFNILPIVITVFGVIFVVSREQPLIAEGMVVWVILNLAGNYFFSRWKLKYDLRSAAADSATTGLLSDAITNQAAISSFAASEYEKTGFKEMARKQARATWLSWDISSVFDGIQGALIVGIEFFLFYYGVKFWQQGAITIGTFVLIQVYLLGLAGQLWGFSRVVRTVYEGFADAEEMVSIMNLPHEVKDVAGAKPLSVGAGKIEIKNLSFAFGSGKPVFENINITVRGGEKVAIIGPSGAGKSTLIRLIGRTYNVKEDTILIDGQDIQKVTQESLRNATSVVPQDPVLFHRTLLENIRYGRREASDEEVFAAAKLAHCDEFIDKLPHGYDTLVGERGIKLSGGERQRVAIARAILKNAPILILDEATSSLDSHSETLIQDALDKLMKGKTVIVIAHRLSTIRKMDRIIVIRNGMVVEEGTHNDLVERDESLYKHLWSLQAGGFIASS